MTNYREILRLSNLELNKTQIAQCVGCSRTTVIQVLNIAEEKGISYRLPDCFNRIIDLQRVFPRMMRIANFRRTQKMALREAVWYLGIDLNNKKVHDALDALYDAEITSEILKSLLSGEYKNQINCIKQLTQSSHNTLGDVCGEVLMNLLTTQMQLETA